jgi:hypothetical protein
MLKFLKNNFKKVFNFFYITHQLVFSRLIYILCLSILVVIGLYLALNYPVIANYNVIAHGLLMVFFVTVFLFVGSVLCNYSFIFNFLKNTLDLFWFFFKYFFCILVLYTLFLKYNYYYLILFVFIFLVFFIKYLKKNYITNKFLKILVNKDYYRLFNRVIFFKLLFFSFFLVDSSMLFCDNSWNTTLTETCYSVSSSMGLSNESTRSTLYTLGICFIFGTICYGTVSAYKYLVSKPSKPSKDLEEKPSEESSKSLQDKPLEESKDLQNNSSKEPEESSKSLQSNSSEYSSVSSVSSEGSSEGSSSEFDSKLTEVAQKLDDHLDVRFTELSQKLDDSLDSKLNKKLESEFDENLFNYACQLETLEKQLNEILYKFSESEGNNLNNFMLVRESILKIEKSVEQLSKNTHLITSLDTSTSINFDTVVEKLSLLENKLTQYQLRTTEHCNMLGEMLTQTGAHLTQVHKVSVGIRNIDLDIQNSLNNLNTTINTNLIEKIEGLDKKLFVMRKNMDVLSDVVKSINKRVYIVDADQRIKIDRLVDVSDKLELNLLSRAVKEETKVHGLSLLFDSLENIHERLQSILINSVSEETKNNLIVYVKNHDNLFQYNGLVNNIPVTELKNIYLSNMPNFTVHTVFECLNVALQQTREHSMTLTALSEFIKLFKLDRTQVDSNSVTGLDNHASDILNDFISRFEK